MKTVNKDVKTQMWEQVNGAVLAGLRVIIESKKPNAKKLEVITDIVAEVFKGGVDLGYDMGAKVFGDE